MPVLYKNMTYTFLFSLKAFLAIVNFPVMEVQNYIDISAKQNEYLGYIK